MRNNLLIVESIKNLLKICPIKKIQQYNSEITVVVKSTDILDILLFFKNHFLCQFKILTSVAGVDYPENQHRFSIFYELLSTKYNVRFKIKIFTSELRNVFSIRTVYSSAGWFESEIWDQFGVFFENHRNLKSLLTDYGFQGSPLRKDFPLSGFIEVRYSELQKRIVSESIELTQEYRTFSYVSPWN